MRRRSKESALEKDYCKCDESEASKNRNAWPSFIGTYTLSATTVSPLRADRVYVPMKLGQAFRFLEESPLI